MNPPTTCQKCGAQLPVNAPEGLCPACLMSGAFPTGAQTVKMSPSEKPGAQPVPTPSAQELAPYFPQLEILELLGRGGMGTVYKARQKNLNRLVALKILSVDTGADGHFAERFQREAQALARLNHPNIVSVFDFGESNGLYYFLMEFVDGANLRTLIRSGEMKPEAALALIPAFCDALQFAHDEGVVHRDIKPENVLVDKKGRVKIADFGLAKLLGHETADHALTRTGMYLGTPRYMAPEQMDKPETVDHRADIYSLGVVFYEMLTGEVPMGRFDPPSKKVQVDVKFDEIVLHAMERDVTLRYQHASEIKTDVQNVTSTPRPTTVVAQAPTASDQPDQSPLGDPAKRAFNWLRAFGALMLGWGVVAALWNLRTPGCVAGALVMSGILMDIMLRRARRNPRWLTAWQRARKVSRIAWLSGFLLMSTLGFIFLFSAIIVRWDASPFHWNTSVVSAETFEAQHKGKEHQLIRQLDAFQDSMPTTELSRNGGHQSWGTPLWGDTPPSLGYISSENAGFLLLLAAIVLFLLAQQYLAADKISVWRWNVRGGWRTAAALFSVVLASAALAYFAMHLLTHFQHGATVVASPYKRLTVAASVEQADATVTQWAKANGYATGDVHRWDFATIPKGNTVAKIEITNAWKPSPFDRWQMTALGWHRISPHLAFQILGTDQPAQSIISISSGDVMSQDSPQWKVWEREIAGAAAVIEKAGKSDPSKPSGPSANAGQGNALPAKTRTQAPLASEIFHKMEAKYASLSSFSATGKVVSEITPAGGTTPFTTEHTFTINLARPDFYRIEWTQKMNAVFTDLTMEGAVWSSGGGPTLLMPGGVVTKPLNREQALTLATGISGGAAHRVPSLFFKEKSLDWISSLKNPSRLPDQKIDNEDCHVISADDRSGMPILWITKKDSFLKQIRSTTGGADFAKKTSHAVSQGVLEVSDASLEKLLRVTGREATPEAVAALRKSAPLSEKILSQAQTTITQTFQSIAVNQIMEKADFEHPLPANATTPATSNPPAIAPAP